MSVHPKNIVFTGFRDPALQQQLERAGHAIKSGVSKKTDMLIEKVKGSGSVKEKKAMELQIPIYSYDEFMATVVDTLLGR